MEMLLIYIGIDIRFGFFNGFLVNYQKHHFLFIKNKTKQKLKNKTKLKHNQISNIKMIRTHKKTALDLQNIGKTSTHFHYV